MERNPTLKKLTDDLKSKVFAHCEQSKSSAEGPRQEFLAKWVEAHKYKNGELPRATFMGEQFPDGVTPYVEPVLREAIKEALPQLLDSFTSDKRLAVSFRSRGWNNNQKRNDLITANINKIFLDEQDGYGLIEKTINEALNPGSAFNKVFVDESTYHETATLKDWVELAEFAGMLSEEWKIDPPSAFGSKKSGDVKGFEWKQSKNEFTDPQTGQKVSQPLILIRGTIPLIKVDRKIKAEFVEAKDLWFDTSNGDDFNKSRYVCHRVLTTVGEAELKGYDKEKLAAAALNDKDVMIDEYATTGDHFDNNSVDEKERKIYLYEHYIYSSLLHEKGEIRQYQVIATQHEILEVNEVPFFPFVHCKKEIVIGSFYGRGFFEDAKPFQILETKKARQADHNADLSTYGRYLAVKGQYNRESLLNHRPGAIVEQMSAGAVDRLPHSELGQSFAYSYDKLQQSKEQSLRRGFGSANLEEIPPIATATVAMGVYQDAQRGMLLSKTIARTYLNPLFSLIYEIMRSEGWPLDDENGQVVQGVEMPSLYDLTVDVQTKGDDAAQVMQLQVMGQILQMVAPLQASYLSDANKYQWLKLACKSADLDAESLITDPATIPEDQHAQQMQKELQSLQHIAAKHQLQSVILANWKTAAEINELEQKAHSTISGEAIQHEESLARIQGIVATAKNQADANAVKAQEVGVKDKAVNYETILAAHKHAADITAPQVNGVR
ncbi:hypothetical protein ATY61_004610 [Salmonella enterica subsp. enterica serovar Saintpaul]|nr:hypothetical protein [Salmonella enterica subsp. enterica serovar Saintpaul]